MEKCSVTADRRLKGCKGFQLIEGRSHSGRGGGVAVKSYISNKTFKLTRQLPTIYAGSYTKNGLVMNFCPMCGADLTALTAEVGSDVT